MTDPKPERPRVLARTDAIQDAWPLPDNHHSARPKKRYHRFPLRDRDAQELLHQRGIEVSIVVNEHPYGAIPLLEDATPP